MDDTDDTVSVRISRTLWESIRWVADHEGRSGTKQLERLVRESLARTTAPPKENARDALR